MIYSDHGYRKTRNLYRQIKNLKEQFEADKGWYSASIIQETYHPLIDQLTDSTGQDCSMYKISGNAHRVMNDTTPIYQRLPVLSNMGMVIGFLEDLLDIDDNNSNINNNGVTVINQNTIALNIQNTINQLIEKSSNEEERDKLNELKEELEKPEKDWGRIKDILIWILNFSKDLFIQILPELLKKIS